jgi:AcrR family transcriptional regulator
MATQRTTTAQRAGRDWPPSPVVYVPAVSGVSASAPASRNERRKRRTQRERSEATRTALLDATIESLIEDGFAKTTTARVSERAGLSRGAHLHHFRTRAGLLTAALERFGERLATDVEQRAKPLLAHSADPTADGLDLLWDISSGALFIAAIDLWAVARTDPELRKGLLPAERAINRNTTRVCRLLFAEYTDRPDFDRLIDFALSTIRGLALLHVVQPSLRTREARWRYARAQVLEAFRRPPLDEP